MLASPDPPKPKLIQHVLNARRVKRVLKFLRFIIKSSNNRSYCYSFYFRPGMYILIKMKRLLPVINSKKQSLLNLKV